MKRIICLFLLVIAKTGFCQTQTEDWYGPVNISFHGFICHRPTNDDGLGMDGVDDEVSVHFWNWGSVSNNRANYNGMMKIYGEDFLLPNRIKAGTATINGGIKAGDSYFRPGGYGDNDPLILSNHAIVNTFCSQNTVIAILPTIWENDNGNLGVTPIQDFGVKTNRFFNEMATKQKMWAFRDNYVFDENNSLGFIQPGADLGFDAQYAGMFTSHKNKLATRPIGLLPNWDYSSQVLILTPKTIKIISERDFGHGVGIVPIVFNEESMGNSFGHGNYTLLLRVVADIKLRNPPTPPAEPTYKLGVAYASSIMSINDRFEVELNGTERITIDNTHRHVYFNKAFRKGETYTLRQISGTRNCNFSGAEQGTFQNTDIDLTLGCGSPPLTIFKMNVTGVEQGEIFKFTDGLGRTLTIPVSALVNLGGFPQGDPYQITQIEGPRPCVLTPAFGTVPSTPQTIQCDCKKPVVSTPPPKPANAYDLVTRSTDNKVLNTYYESWAPVIAGKGEDDGRYVAFSMYGKGIDGSTGKYRQLFWRDRKTGVTKLISRSASGEEGNANSSAPAISADGQFVAFETYATNFGVGDNNGVRDVFVWNANTDALTLISRSQTGNTANSESYEPVISGDGSVIAYTSNASDIVNLGPVYSTPNVYVLDRNSGLPIFITKDFETGKAVGGYAPTISEDGNKVAFCAYNGRLVRNDNNNLWDIFLWQNGMPELKRISVLPGGAERDQGNESSSRVVWPSISGDGNSIVYATTSTNLVNNDNNGLQDIFLCDLASGNTKRISTANGSDADGDSPISQGERIGISYDGSWIAYNTNANNLGVLKGNIVAQNTLTGKTIAVTNLKNVSTARPMISRHGYYVVAGCSQAYDKRFATSGIFAFYLNHVE